MRDDWIGERSGPKGVMERHILLATRKALGGIKTHINHIEVVG